MTATPIAGTSSSRHLRLAPGGDPLPSLADDRRDDQGVRMCDPYSLTRGREYQVVPLARRSRRLTASPYETLSDGI
jgi:hypothetical protein